VQVFKDVGLASGAFPSGLEVDRAGTSQTIASISAGAASSTNVCFGKDAVYTTVFEKGVYKIPIAGIRGFLHPGASKYNIEQMLDLTPVNDPL
jgi:hypothetical protein